MTQLTFKEDLVVVRVAIIGLQSVQLTARITDRGRLSRDLGGVIGDRLGVSGDLGAL